MTPLYCIQSIHTRFFRSIARDTAWCSVLFRTTAHRAIPESRNNVNKWHFHERSPAVSYLARAM